MSQTKAQLLNPLNGNLNVTGVVTASSFVGGVGSFSAGSASAPSVSIRTSTNGLYSPGADQLALSTAGTGRLFVDANGNVGIGTSIPAQLLHVSGSGTQAIRVENTLGTGNASIELKLTNNTFTTSVNNTSIFYNDTAGREYIWYQNSVERLRITSDGKFGLGNTTGLGGTLGVSGHISLSGVAGGSRYIGLLNETNTYTGSLILQAGGGSASFGGAISMYGHSHATYPGSVYIGGTGAAGASIIFGIGNAIDPVSEKVRIDSSGRLLVGTSTGLGTNNSITVKGTAASNPSIYFARNANASSIVTDNVLGFFEFGSGDGGLGAEIRANADGAWSSTSDCPSRLVFSTTADGAASPTEAMRINNQRELLIGTTTRTANGGVLQVSNGITFPGTQSACSDPNTLDDYEEGTFTPTIVGTTAAGVGTYSVQVGRYTKTGNRVYYNVTLTWSAHTGTGNMRLSGLPFTTNATTGSNAAASVVGDSLTTPASTYPVCITDVNNTQLLFYSSAVAGGALAALAIDTAATIYVAGHYEV